MGDCERSCVWLDDAASRLHLVRFIDDWMTGCVVNSMSMCVCRFCLVLPLPDDTVCAYEWRGLGDLMFEWVGGCMASRCMASVQVPLGWVC